MNRRSTHKILVVDDEQSILDLYHRFLSAPDLKVKSTHSYDEALLSLRENHFDLIITDLHLNVAGKYEGFELIKKVKDLHPDTKIVLITGYGDEKTKSKAAELGVSFYIEKPLQYAELSATIRLLLNEKSGTAIQLLSNSTKHFHRSLIKLIQTSIDTLVLASAFYASYLLRFDFSLPEDQVYAILRQLPIVLIVQFSALVLAGVYSLVWRYTGFREVKTFVASALASLLPLLIMRLFLPSNWQVYRFPISISIMTTVLGFGGLLTIRLLRRSLYERYQRIRLQSDHEKESRNANPTGSASRDKQRVLLIGAGQAGVHAAKEIQKRGDLDIELVGFIDDDTSKKGLYITGVKVLGSSEDLPVLVPNLSVDHVVITIAHATRVNIARIVGICEKIPVKVRIIPGLFELIDGKVEVNRIRDVEIEDLLGREKIELELDAMHKFLANKRVMVTGAGGSIGSELVRQVQKFFPQKILMVERSEFALYQIQMEVCRSKSSSVCVPLIADISDEERMTSIFKHYKPHVILHAAAHKHVPLMEFNPTEAIKNNTLATWKLAKMAGKFQTDVFVLISTDKAVNPTSIMGASKRMAELLIQGLNGLYDTRYLAVRFGNVLGSTGSVIPLFRDQIRKGGPVTVTHPDMTRYFMTIPEAAQLVLQAGTMGQGAEIFILDMGAPVKIIDLAESMIRLSGLKPHEDILITYTGLRPGEKLFEELNTQDDHVDQTRHPKIFIGKIKEFESEKVAQVVEALSSLSTNGFEPELRKFISDLLPESTLTLTSDSSSS